MPPGVGYGPQYQADQQSIERRRKMAQAIAQQALTPQQGQMAGRIYVPPGPLSAISRVAQAYFGGQGMKRADEEEAALGERVQGQQSEEMRKVTQALLGQQAIEQPPAELGGGPGRPATPPNPRQAIVEAMNAQSPAVQGMVPQLFGAEKAQQDRIARMEQNAATLEARAEDRALDRESRERMAKEANALRLQIAELTRAAGGRSPYFQFLPTSSGYARGNTRTGDVELATGPDGKPLMRATDDPQRQGDIAAARTRGEAQAKREFNMSGIGATIDRAEKILGGTNPETGAAQALPTGSGMGSLVDKAAGFVGMSPRGAAEATELKAIAGALTSKMPRMEGPQSDRDTQLYREMAAQVGDDTIPVEQRLRALESVKALWRKYERNNPDAFAAPEGVPQDVWSAMTPKERALWAK